MAWRRWSDAAELGAGAGTG
uniref:Uncharacterized protein n=1 Tax=Arundo donax TaxID=35708 RepID=A0A0A9F341_ARUDO